MSGKEGSGGSWAGGSMSDADILWLLILLPFVAPAGLAMLPGVRDGVVEWLVQHGVLVAAAEDPWWTIPGIGGAGIDVRRLVIITVVMIGLLACLLSWVQAVRRRRIHARLVRGDQL